MFTFSVVKKIGEGSYLDEALFIIERVRRERALNMHWMKTKNKKCKTKSSTRNEKGKSS
ncbi:MAG: hypothetical protein WBC74_00495 [Candidatus Omnitrophota bacterium]